jgi:hypothetical protein
MSPAAPPPTLSSASLALALRAASFGKEGAAGSSGLAFCASIGAP